MADHYGATTLGNFPAGFREGAVDFAAHVFEWIIHWFSGWFSRLIAVSHVSDFEIIIS